MSKRAVFLVLLVVLFCGPRVARADDDDDADGEGHDHHNGLSEREDARGRVVFATTTSGVKLEFEGRSPNVRLYPNATSSDWLQLNFGAVQELDARGRPVRGVRSFSSAKPTWTSGYELLGGVANVSFVTMSLTLNNTTAPEHGGPDGDGGDDDDEESKQGGGGGAKHGASCTLAPPATPGQVNVTIHFGFTENTTVPYGPGNVTVAAGAVKWTISALDWPFCEDTNTLNVDLSVTASQHEAAAGANSSQPQHTSGEASDDVVLVDDAGEVESVPLCGLAADGQTLSCNGTAVNGTSAAATSAPSATTAPTTTPATRKLLLLLGKRSSCHGSGRRLLLGKPDSEEEGKQPGGGHKPDSAPAAAGGKPEDDGEEESTTGDAKGGHGGGRDKPHQPEVRPPKGGKMAAFRVGDAGRAAAIAAEALAYPSANATTGAMLVALSVRQRGDGNQTTVMTFSFPRFASLYYDPTTSFATADSLGLPDTNATNAVDTTTTTTTSAGGVAATPPVPATGAALGLAPARAALALPALMAAAALMLL